MKRFFLIGASCLCVAVFASSGLSSATAQLGNPFSNDSDETQMPEQQFGWQTEPRQIDPEELERPLTELERLSLSTSGVRYGRDAYDPRADNPLEPVSVTLRALDKITARYTDLVIDMNATSHFGTLAITPRTCDKRPPEEVPEVSAFLEVEATDDFVPVATLSADDRLDPVASDDIGSAQTTGFDSAAVEPDGPVARPDDVDEGGDDDPNETQARRGGLTAEDDDADSTLFSGWMFASSPALNALEHPVYDIWVVDCKMVDPGTDTAQSGGEENG